MIEIKELCYIANNKKILDSVVMTAQNRAITVIVGNNGSGKTTLLRSIASYHEHKQATEGRILVDGIEISELSPIALSSRISLLPQTLPSPKMTVRELVSLGRASLRSPFSRASAEDRLCVDRAISDMGLAELADSQLSQLSGGERQAAYFAMVLAKDTANVILDEPTSALDSSNRSLIFSFLAKMREQGRCVVVVLHDLTDAVAIADSIILLDRGRSVFCGTPTEFGESDLPLRVFDLRACTLEVDGEQRTVYLPRKK